MAARVVNRLTPGMKQKATSASTVDAMTSSRRRPIRSANIPPAFAALLSLPDDAIDLGQAALLIARDEYPHLDVGAYLVRLDQMADTIRGRLRGGEGFTSQIAHLNRLLFDDLGFRGNVRDYYDPRNSFLNDVLDRRVGIPISLSTIYLEVARRIGCPLA